MRKQTRLAVRCREGVQSGTLLNLTRGGRPPEKVCTLGHRSSFDCIALLLQGGGALGAYQAGVYEALAEADLWPDFVAGTSIGGINSAIIAGNTREKRIAKLREFWELVSRSPFGFKSGRHVQGRRILPPVH